MAITKQSSVTAPTGQFGAAAAPEDVIYVASEGERKAYQGVIEKINASTGASTRVEVREPAFRPGSYGC